MTCEILMVRNVADTNGYPCGRTANAECSDCGSRLCDLHSEQCEICRETYCSTCLTFHVVHSKPSSAVPIETERRRA